MNGSSYLLSQIEALSEELDIAKNSMELLDNKKLLHAMRARFLNLFNTRQAELKDLSERSIKKISSNDKLGDEWEELQNCCSNCADLFREYLTYFGGAMLRSSPLDSNEICQVADALLYYLNYWSNLKWDRFTIMSAEGESFAEMTEIIRVRFPEFNIWRLPLVAHEFGHYAMPTINYDKHYPFKDIILEANGKEEECIDPKKWVERKKKSRLQEIFADVFATYLIGPAYPSTLILLSFNPRDNLACVDGITHPSHNKRVYCSLKMLEEMSRPQTEYSGITGYLRETWQRNLESVGYSFLSKDLENNCGKLVENWNKELTWALAKVKYNGWLQVEDLMEALNSNSSRGQIDDYTLPDVMNAAWRCRIKYANNDGKGENSIMVQKINKKALDLCRKIIENEGSKYAPGWSK
jgi:hypothetical protein